MYCITNSNYHGHIVRIDMIFHCCFFTIVDIAQPPKKTPIGVLVVQYE